MTKERAKLVEDLDAVNAALHSLAGAPYVAVPSNEPNHLEELVRIAIALGVPLDVDPAPADRFLASLGQIADATWGDCGAILRKLREGGWHKHLKAASYVGSRIQQLQQSHP